MPAISESYARCEEPAESRWFLIYCKPGRERQATENLLRQSYELYFPEVLGRIRKQDCWVERITPLFPRYLFLKLDRGRQCLAPVRSTTGVSGVVRFGADYAQVPGRVIANLRARADAATGLHRLVEPAPLRAGTRVRIVSGVFDGLDGVFMRESGEARVVVLLDLLGSVAPVRVPTVCVMPASHALARTGT